jgi:2-(1,2-epoxy-1,2-dihydrophenyl)acetyl-CoA isomerase
VAYEQILYDQRDDVAVITLNRPDKLNAWTPLMSLEMQLAIEAADADRSVGAVVLTGAGRGFCAGADISAVFDAQLQGDSEASKPLATRDWIELIRSTKPIVAAVNGPAIGIGLTMILPFDRIVCAEGAKLSVRFVKMGLVPELASSMFLPARCGLGGASDLMLSGRTILADEALRIGLVDEVAGPDALLDTALERARSYAENSPAAVRSIKALITQNMNEVDPLAVQRRELGRLQEAYKSAEHKEAVAAFMEKRKPVFR